MYLCYRQRFLCIHMLASYPCARGRGAKGAPGTHCLRMTLYLYMITFVTRDVISVQLHPMHVCYKQGKFLSFCRLHIVKEPNNQGSMSMRLSFRETVLFFNQQGCLWTAREPLSLKCSSYHSFLWCSWSSLNIHCTCQWVPFSNDQEQQLTGRPSRLLKELG